MKRFFRARVNYNHFSKIHEEELEKTGQFFQVAIHFHPSHPQINMNDTSFCALVGLLLMKLNHYFDVYIHTDVFRLLEATLKLSDTASSMIENLWKRFKLKKGLRLKKSSRLLKRSRSRKNPFLSLPRF